MPAAQTLTPINPESEQTSEPYATDKKSGARAVCDIKIPEGSAESRAGEILMRINEPAVLWMNLQKEEEESIL